MAARDAQPASTRDSRGGSTEDGDGYGGTQHLQIQPKSDLVLFYGLAARIIELGRTDADFIAAYTQDFVAFERFLADYSLEKAAQASGITIEKLDALAHQSVPVSGSPFGGPWA